MPARCCDVVFLEVSVWRLPTGAAGLSPPGDAPQCPVAMARCPEGASVYRTAAARRLARARHAPHALRTVATRSAFVPRAAPFALLSARAQHSVAVGRLAAAQGRPCRRPYHRAVLLADKCLRSGALWIAAGSRSTASSAAPNRWRSATARAGAVPATAQQLLPPPAWQPVRTPLQIPYYVACCCLLSAAPRAVAAAAAASHL
mmetsp:Transcript_25353/g.65281  ORF Transcript_25353/g.65281 Transcript_25353/m.65281 type:complete len:203 (+) Transcript_25353:124-732(+)